MGVQTTYPDYALATAGVPFAGMLADNGDDVGIKMMYNAEASAQLALGEPVARFLAGGPQAAKRLAASTDIVAGIILHTNAASNAPGGDLGTTGLLPGAFMNVLRSGRVWATCITGCAIGDRLFVSYAVGGPYTAAGQLGNVTQASTTIDCTTKAEWQTVAAAGAVAILDCDFVNK